MQGGMINDAQRAQPTMVSSSRRRAQISPGNEGDERPREFGCGFAALGYSMSVTAGHALSRLCHGSKLISLNVCKGCHGVTGKTPQVSLHLPPAGCRADLPRRNQTEAGVGRRRAGLPPQSAVSYPSNVIEVAMKPFLHRFCTIFGLFFGATLRINCLRKEPLPMVQFLMIPPFALRVSESPGIALDRRPEGRFQAILTPIFLKFDGSLTGAICKIPNVYAGPDGLTGPAPQRAPPHPSRESHSVPFAAAITLFKPRVAAPEANLFLLQSEPNRSKPRQSEAIRGIAPGIRAETPVPAVGSLPGGTPVLRTCLDAFDFEHAVRKVHGKFTETYRNLRKPVEGYGSLWKGALRGRHLLPRNWSPPRCTK